MGDPLAAAICGLTVISNARFPSLMRAPGTHKEALAASLKQVPNTNQCAFAAGGGGARAFAPKAS